MVLVGSVTSHRPMLYGPKIRPRVGHMLIILTRFEKRLLEPLVDRGLIARPIDAIVLKGKMR